MASAKMKAKDYRPYMPDRNATNSSGFNALRVSYRLPDGTFFEFGNVTGFWSSTPSESENAFSRLVGYGSGAVNRSSDNRAYGYSVRCIKD